MTPYVSKQGAGGGTSRAADAQLVVPIRRTRWVSFWVGAAAAGLSLLSASALTGLFLLLAPGMLDGAAVIIFFALILFTIFFLSLPRQRRYARALDARRPGARLCGGRLSIPLPDDDELTFDLGEPHELTFGWFEVLIRGSGGPTTNTRGLMTYAVLTQAGRALFLQAEDSVREAQAAGWPNRTGAHTPDKRVRLWASDLVTLVDALRSYNQPEATPPSTTMTTTDNGAPREKLREWPGNPLPARNRHEATLFLEWLKAEVLSRTPAEGGEVCVARVRGADTSAPPDTYRFVFRLLGHDPVDENDLGAGVSQILDPADLMLLLSRMEREGSFGQGGLDAVRDASHVLTYMTTREVEALRRAHARGLSIINQLSRFADADGQTPEDSIKGSTKRTWFRGARARFDFDALEARRRKLSETLRLLQPAAAGEPGASKQSALVNELSARCPEYLDELRRAGYEVAQYEHPLFSHAYHLTRYAVQALLAGDAEKTRAAFAAWAAAEPNELHFPARELAEAAFQLKLDPEAAGAFVPASGRHYFYTHYDSLLDPDYNPWSY